MARLPVLFNILLLTTVLIPPAVFIIKNRVPRYAVAAQYCLSGLVTGLSGILAARYITVSFRVLRRVFENGHVTAFDLIGNFTATASLQGPYVRGGVLNTTPGLSLPPVFAFFSLLMRIFGDEYAVFEARYRTMLILCGLLTLGCLVIYTLRHTSGGESPLPSGKANVNRPTSFAGAWGAAAIVLLVFVLAAYRDWLAGNTALIVTLLVLVQIMLADWDSKISPYLQGFLICAAFILKPNIILVPLFFVVFSFRQRKYEYLAGLIGGCAVFFFLSLLSPIIELSNYRTFVFETSRTIQTLQLGNTGNLSLERIGLLQPVGGLISKMLLLLMAAVIVFFAGRSDDLVRQEIPCLLATVIPWPIFWSIYLSWVAVAVWIWILMKLKEGEGVYLETLSALLLSWYGIMYPNPLAANLILLFLLLLFFKKPIGKYVPRLVSFNPKIS
ncbi:MAG: hypothetical protein C4520_00090 [Candidatus Abyssobacteria bacterium SURF_5]|uniref:Uncharacterized protein n=1 Tax=Abyssobacteria bacterium (strain SURF_5) TaxID=2093360 RepID=A0A3A4P7K2_ABYX5|nr:MAG: hypothetical protein C4520_00090 [Candidatus Abyssubacteria bacterium SURF_5]